MNFLAQKNCYLRLGNRRKRASLPSAILVISRSTRASGNSATERYIRDINERIRLIRIHDFTTPDRIEATIEEHLEILETIRARRADAAAALMRVHIERSAEVVERRVGELLARMFEEERP